MRAHSLKCPIYFDPMFFKEDGSDYTEEEWKNVKLEEVMSMVSYELFYDGKSARDELLDSIETLSNGVKKYLLKILEPVSDPDYTRTWSGTGELHPRVLLYPAGHINRRLKGEEHFKNMGDLAFFLAQLNTLGIRIQRNPDASIGLRARAGGPLAHLKPCCPRCHTILPDEWFNSVGYYKISLLGPPLGGKTTLLSSWMVQEYSALRSIVFFSKKCSAVYGLARGDSEFEIQKYFRKTAENLFETGQYPGRDEPSRKPPLYTRIIHYTDEIQEETGKKEEYLILGTYDIAGETLKNIQSDEERGMELTAYLNYMDAYIYLISPSQLSGLSRIITDEKPESRSLKENLALSQDKIRVLSLEEQAEYQKTFLESGQTISAVQLLEPAKESRIKYDPWGIFHKIDNLLIQEGMKAKVHMAYTLVKSDQIMELPEIAELVDTETVFQNPADVRAMDSRYIAQNESVVKEILKHFAISGNQQKKKEFLDYLSCTGDSSGFQSVSWHCVSAHNEKNTAAYESIRKTDPLIGCLLAAFQQLGW